MASIQPTTGIIESVRRQGMPWHLILGELIDNSFDAGATRVSIVFDKKAKSLTVRDNGHGCEDLLSMLVLGDRNQHSTTQLGRYGIGAKDAAISVAEGVTVCSVHRGIMRTVTCNWKNLERSGSWEIADPIETPTDDEPGTTISMYPMFREKPSSFEALERRLSLQYTPAIQQGRQITICESPKHPGRPLRQFHVPEMTHQITADLDVDGKKARVMMGIIPENRSVERSGLVVAYGYRVIKENQRIGLGSDPTPNLFGWIDLLDGWELTKNKDNISCNLDALGDAIYNACKNTIATSARQASSVLFEGVAKEINDALSVIVGQSKPTKKAKRATAKNPTGAVEPKGTKRRHTNAMVIQAGETFGGNNTKVKVSFESMGTEGPACRYQNGVVYLNRDIPIVAKAAQDQSMLAIHAIYAAATWFATTDGPQLKLFEDRDATDVIQKMAVLAGELLRHVMNTP